MTLLQASRQYFSLDLGLVGLGRRLVGEVRDHCEGLCRRRHVGRDRHHVHRGHHREVHDLRRRLRRVVERRLEEVGEEPYGTSESYQTYRLR